MASYRGHETSTDHDRNRLISTPQGDITTLRKRGHFYFALTVPATGEPRGDGIGIMERRV